MGDPLPRAPDNALHQGDADALNQQERDLITVAKGGGISFVGTAVTRVSNYLYGIVLVWGLGGETFGLYILSLAIVNFVGVVAELGLSLSVVRFGAIGEARGQSSIHKVTMTALLISLPLGLVLLVLLKASASMIAENVFHKPELSMLLKVLAWSVPLVSVQSLLTAATRAFKMIRYSALVWMTQSLSALVLAILFMVLQLGLQAIVFSLVFSHVLGAGLALFFYLRVIPRTKAPGLYPMRQLVRFSLPLTLTKWIQFANERTEVLFLGLLPSTVYVGIYKIAWSLAGLETILRLSLEDILAPFSSSLSHSKGIRQLDSLYKTTAKWSFTGALMLASVYLLFGATLMSLFDPTFVAGTSVLLTLALAQLFNEATGACGTILIMSGRSDLSLLNTVVLFASSVALDWALIPRFGLSGAAFAGAFTIILVNILRVTEVWLVLRIHPFAWSFLKPILAGAAGVMVIWGARFFIHSATLLADVIYGILFAAIYVTVIWLLKLDADDLLILRAIQRKTTGLVTRLRAAA